MSGVVEMQANYEVRGGSWFFLPHNARVACRSTADSSLRNGRCGLRLVRRTP